jgi:hypothetical protein
MTTSKPQASFDSKALGATKPSEIAPVAWDPYEVWRTRVLLPRLVERARLSTVRQFPPVAVNQISPPG